MPNVEYGASEANVGLKENARFINCLSPLPWANSFMSPPVVSSLPRTMPNCSDKNCVNITCDSTISSRAGSVNLKHEPSRFLEAEPGHKSAGVQAA